MHPRPPAATLTHVLSCLIVDDNASFLEAAAGALERDGLSVVGTASNIEDGLRRARELQPDVVLIDIAIGAESGFDLARRLAENGSPATRILVSTHAEADFADLIATSPVAGFVSKSELSAAAIERLIGFES